MADAPEQTLPADFGKYRLVRRIATGGMAEIFLAHRHEAPLEPLVIKRILPHLGKSREFVQMFNDEARLASRIEHENVVKIDDLGMIDGASYIAMEYVHGEDIRRIYNRAYKLQRSLPLSHSIRVLADAARGLAHAHKVTDIAGRPMGIVHRDVSPQNILVTYDGNTKVVDFGIAKAAGKVTQTRAGVLKGKYSYMSPEQALGDEIDHRTDIFALGIILYETTTGTRLFKRQNELATLQAIIRCEFVPPTEALENYPPALEEILLRALARNPADRYGDAEELTGELYAFLEESGLFVERQVIAEFMHDLFADRLEEEDGSGQPALPSEDEVKEEMADATRAEREGARERTDAAGSRPDAAVFPDRGTPGFVPLGSSPVAFDPEPTAAEDPPRRGPTAAMRAPEPQDVRAPAVLRAGRPEGGQPVRAARGRKPERASPEGRPYAVLAGRQADVLSAPPDQAPTVAAEPVYQGPPARARRSDAAATIVPVLPADRTEQVRARDVHLRVEATQPDVRAHDDDPRSKALIVLAAGVALLLFGAVIALWVAKRPPEAPAVAPEPPVAPAAARAAPVAVHTEPAVGWLRLAVAPWARVTVDGKEIGLTPLPKIPLLEGEHTLVLENPDIARRYKTAIRVRAGEESPLKIDLGDVGESM